MPTLQELFLNDENFPRLVADTQALVEGELANKGGIYRLRSRPRTRR